MLLDILADDRFHSILRRALDWKAPLIGFCQTVLDRWRLISESSEDFQLLWNQQIMSRLRQLSEKYQQVSRCFLHLFCAQVPPGAQSTRDRDVTIFSEYVGNSYVDKDWLCTYKTVHFKYTALHWLH